MVFVIGDINGKDHIDNKILSKEALLSIGKTFKKAEKDNVTIPLIIEGQFGLSYPKRVGYVDNMWYNHKNERLMIVVEIPEVLFNPILKRQWSIWYEPITEVVNFSGIKGGSLKYIKKINLKYITLRNFYGERRHAMKLQQTTRLKEIVRRHKMSQEKIIS